MKFAVVDFSLLKNLTSKVCESLDKYNITYERVNIESSSGYNRIISGDFTHVILRAPCDIYERKNVCDEVAFVLEKYTNVKIYPSIKELMPYENKRYLNFVLETCSLPFPKTNVFLNKKEAIEFVENAKLPLIYKSNIGASSSGVRFIRKTKDAKKLINNAFGYHQYIAFGNSPSKSILKVNVPEIGRAEKHFILFQEVVSFKWEWRIIKINNKILAYKKLKGTSGFASGSGKYGYGIPPHELLELNEKVFKSLDINSAAVDYFETEDGEFLINEVQCLFGAKPIYKDFSSQMFDEKMNPIYIELNEMGEFVVKQGDICGNECWDLRIKEFVKLEVSEIR
ncbi:ATP-grasp domain-containing protein [Vibrio chagasii]|uniref:ATP-grasp domain-containing protein n=1 Tax=Vibrio chagasii TaxID=170679 RepID=UPI003BB783BB